MEWGKGYDGEGEEGKIYFEICQQPKPNICTSYPFDYSHLIFAEDETENLEQDFKTSEDRCIFLIDARKEMFEKNRSGEIHIINCMKVALEVMKSKIISSEKSSIAVIFFGTKHATPGLNSTDGIYTLFSLDPPTAQRIRELQELVNDIDEFHEKIGSSTDQYCPLKEAFRECLGSFSFSSQNHKKNDFRRIWLFTNDDAPNSHDPSLVPSMVLACKDCWECDIETSLWHMNREGHGDFQPTKFYTKLLAIGGLEGEPEDAIENRMKGAGYDSFDGMMYCVRRKEHRKRTLGSLMFTLGGDTKMALQTYKTVLVPTFFHLIIS